MNKFVCNKCNLNQCYSNKKGYVYLICRDCMDKMFLDAISTSEGKLKLAMEMHTQIKNNMIKNYLGL